ncbi:MAG: DUF3365 domain-containing protein [Phycisphaerales bacterium]|nr:DUF3365 domain-containing protein [Phycisphaerales bacterium]
MRRIRPAVLLTTLLTLNACERSHPEHSENTDSSSARWVRVDVDHLTSKQAAQRERAIAARDELASTLKGELMDAIQSQGPVHAIEVCHSRAPEIAAVVAELHRVEIGRDASRRRNPQNTGPVWGDQYLFSKISTEIACENSDGTMGFAFPIMLEDACVICHGSDEQIPTAVREAIDQRYPEDSATGFAPGDHRGWFWVQVPPED